MAVEFALGQIARSIGAQLRGEPSRVVKGLAPLGSASQDDLSFLSSKAYETQLEKTRAAVILSEASIEKFQGDALIVDNAYLAYAQVSRLFDPRPRRAVGIHPSAVAAESSNISPTASVGAHCAVGDNVTIGDNCEIYPGVVISENSHIGSNCLLHANVTIYSNVRIGDNVVIHSGTVIGSDGFGFAPTSEGWIKIHQLGGVVIGDNVEIGSGTSIDRGAITDTVIHKGVIIDNQVHLAHNVEVGENTAIAGCVGVAGSTKIGKNCTFAGFVAVNGHISIADNCHFKGGTIVTKTITEAGEYGSAPPVQGATQWRKSAVRYCQLDDIARRLTTLEKSRT